jgi:eukaryotic-like serine/threonine-protein kinase
MSPIQTMRREPREIVDDPEFRGRLEKLVERKYEIDRLIGEGGFGRVYSARDLRLDRRVAIKVIRPDLAGARMFTDRFRNEALALAKFRHPGIVPNPGIVPIYDIQDSEGLPYFVMPLIEGDSLRTRLERFRYVAPQEARRLLVELCHCLAATHRAGIVHRDIKPDNVMLESDALARALLMDFGIAKSMADFENTNSGMMLGTPTYMSPEQVNGDATVDHRSDIYSLGVLGYHMLSGRPPFVGASFNEVVFGHMTRLPEPLRKLNPSVPAPLAEAIMQCLAKDPAERFQSAAELGAALSAVSFADPIESAETDSHYAMPFFGGMFVVAFVAGMDQLRFFTPRMWMWIAAGLGAIATVCSPTVRVTAGELWKDFVDWRKRRA